MLQGCYPICFDVGDARKIVGEHGSCMPLETSEHRTLISYSQFI